MWCYFVRGASPTTGTVSRTQNSTLLKTESKLKTLIQVDKQTAIQQIVVVVTVTVAVAIMGKIVMKETVAVVETKPIAMTVVVIVVAVVIVVMEKEAIAKVNNCPVIWGKRMIGFKVL